MSLNRLGGKWIAPLLAVACLEARAADAPLLVEAAKKADTAAVRALLARGADVNQRQGDGATALHWAAQTGDPALAAVLIGAGANVNAADDLGVTPLWVACSDRTGAIVEQLLKAGANPNVGLPSGETPLMAASRVGNSDAVKLLVERGADVNAREFSRGQTALMWAAAQRHATIVETLTRAGADVHARSKIWPKVVSASAPSFVNSGLAAGLTAQEVDARAAARAAARGGGRAQGAGAGGSTGATAPARAARLQAAAAPAASGVDDADSSGVIEIQEGGYTPLLFAAQQGAIESARALIAAGANVNDTAPIGTSALVVAAHSGQGAFGAFLLEKGADPNAAGAGYTALHAAILRSDVELVNALVAHGANLQIPVMKATPGRRASTDYQLGPALIGATPFWLAARFDEPGIMRALAAGGADIAFALNDTTALMAAMAGPWPGRGMGIPPPAIEIERLALEAITEAVKLGVDVNASNKAGDTALHTAVSRGFDTVVQFLADGGVRLDVKNTRGQTPLATAVTLGRTSTADLLRKSGAKE